MLGNFLFPSKCSCPRHHSTPVNITPTTHSSFPPVLTLLSHTFPTPTEMSLSAKPLVEYLTEEETKNYETYVVCNLPHFCVIQPPIAVDCREFVFNECFFDNPLSGIM